MARVVYKVVKHENGWAYQARGTFSEAFPTHDAALAAARIAAAEQKVPGETVGIEYETEDGRLASRARPRRRSSRHRSRGRQIRAAMVSASDPRTLQKGYATGLGNRRLRASVLSAVAVEIAFLVFFTVFLWNHADPMGDGMEMVGVGMAIMFIFLPFTLPALVLAKESRYLVLAALLAGVAAFLYFALWLEFLDELHIRPAPWS